MYTSPYLDDDNINYYQEMIGCLWWEIELGQSNIATEVDLLSRHLALPRRGHLDQYFNIYTYLKNHPYSKFVMKHAYINLKDKFCKRFNEDVKWSKF